MRDDRRDEARNKLNHVLLDLRIAATAYLNPVIDRKNRKYASKIQTPGFDLLQVMVDKAAVLLKKYHTASRPQMMCQH
ncbi:MAG: hypothetical protein ABGY11_08470 [Candidatus Thioglobus sp.]